MNHRLLLTLTIAVSAVALAQPAQREAFLHQLPLQTTLQGPIDWETTKLKLQVEDLRAKQAAFLTRRKIRPTVGGDTFTIALTEPKMKDSVLSRHKSSSWVIDWEEPAFTPIWEEVVTALGPHPTPDELTAYASKTLTRKSYDRGFDLASQVAKHRSGDCTEHAVFLAALLRRAQIPARGMTGVVLVPTAEQPLAMGHMWVEAFVGGQWRIYDAAIPRELNAKYLPVGELTNEGPSYTVALVELMSALSFKQLQLIQ